MELIVTAGPDKGGRIRLVESARSIGRNELNDLVLTDSAVSGRHAIVRELPNGSVEITDLASTNGIWVGGHRVSGTGVVGAGTLLTIGNDQLLVQFDQHPATERAVRLSETPVAPIPTVANAGPVAGGNIAMSGQAVAGRDLNYHEGFRIRSRMRAGAKRVLRWGVALMVIGMLAGIAAIVAYQQWIFQQAGPDSSTDETDFSEAATFFAIAGAGMLVAFIGLVMIIVSLLMPREQIREVVPVFASHPNDRH